jgi:hypothetical protein
MRTRLDWDVGSLGKATVSGGPNISTSISIITADPGRCDRRDVAYRQGARSSVDPLPGP